MPSPDKASDDDDLWSRVVETVTPLQGRKNPGTRQHRADTVDDGTDDRPDPAPPKAARVGTRRPDPPARRLPLAAGDFAGMDRRQAERLRRGQMPIEDRCDLHGMNRQQARQALDEFLALSRDHRHRCVLVITGQGQKAPLGERTSVLRAEFPNWLNEASLRERVIAFCPAQPKHGGEGAFYVLLKRPPRTTR